HGAVVLVLSGRSVDDDFDGLARWNVAGIDAEFINHEVVQRGALVRDHDGDVGVGRNRELPRLKVDVARVDGGRLGRARIGVGTGVRVIGRHRGAGLGGKDHATGYAGAAVA